MKTIKGNLILEKDTTFKESIKVEGNIKGWVNLRVEGDIDAWNINAWDIDAWNINAGDIDAEDINALNINAGDIDARDIICENRIKKDKKNKTICRVFVENKSKIERREKLK